MTRPGLFGWLCCLFDWLVGWFGWLVVSVVLVGWLSDLVFFDLLGFLVWFG